MIYVLLFVRRTEALQASHLNNRVILFTAVVDLELGTPVQGSHYTRLHSHSHLGAIKSCQCTQ